MELRPPHDRYYIVYCIFLLQGIGILTPWNMFITAKPYFIGYKLSSLYIGYESIYVIYFETLVGLASQIPCVLISWLYTFVILSGNTKLRIICSICVEIFIFVLTIGLACTDSTTWPVLFFWLTLKSIVVLNIARGVHQNSIYGIAAIFPAKYMGALVLGTYMSGALVSIINILTTEYSTFIEVAAIFYFFYAIFVLWACLNTYLMLSSNKYYKHHMRLGMLKSEKQRQVTIVTTRPPFQNIFKQAFPQLFNIFLAFFITSNLFPTMISDIKSELDLKGNDSTYNFLTYNVGAMIGSVIATKIQIKKEKLVLSIVSMVVYIPLLLFFNYQPHGMIRTLPVLTMNFWILFILLASIGFWSGYLSSLSMMYAPQMVAPEHAKTVGMFAAAMLVSGIALGFLTSLIYPHVVGERIRFISNDLTEMNL